MSIESLFPTLLYRAPLAREGAVARKIARDVVRESLISREIDDEGRAWSEEHYLGGYTSYASLNDLHLRFSTFADLRARIDKHVNKFARALRWDLQGGALRMTACWINVMGAGASHGSHLHPLSAVSGAYYARVPKGASPIKFEDPRLASFMGAPPRREPCARPHRAHVATRAEPGDVLLFESWLRHEVPSNRSSLERVSVSFNYAWE